MGLLNSLFESFITRALMFLLLGHLFVHVPWDK
jgi:hypothetical protein